MTVFPGREGRESRQIALAGNRLVFTREGARIIEIPYLRLQIRIGGQNTQHFFFTDRLQPGVEVCGQNRRILESLAASGVSEAREMLARAKRKHTLRLALRSIPFVLACSFFSRFRLRSITRPRHGSGASSPTSTSGSSAGP